MKSPTRFSKMMVASDATAAMPTKAALAKVGRHSNTGETPLAGGPLSAGWYRDMISCVLGMNQATASAAVAMRATSLDGRLDIAGSTGISDAPQPNMLPVMPNAVSSVGERKNTQAMVTSRNVISRPAHTDHPLRAGLSPNSMCQP